MEATESKMKENKTQICLLLNDIGEEGIDIYNTFNVDMSKATLDEVLKLFDDYCNPRKKEVFERYKFWQRNQGTGESVDAYVTELRRLAKTCEFGDQIEKMLRDKIVIGANNERIKDRLLREEKLTLKRALELYHAHEATIEQLKQMTTEPTKVDVVKKNPMLRNSKKCSYCGGLHEPRKCPAYGKVCKRCNKRNHFQEVCRSRQVNELEKENEEVQPDALFIGSLSNSSKPWTMDGVINGSTVTMKLDTGAEANVLSRRIFEKLQKKPRLQPAKVVLTAFGGSKISACGKAALMVELPGREPQIVEFIIADVDDKQPQILGLKSLTDLDIIKCTGIDAIDQRLDKNTVLKAYTELFFDDLGCLPYVHKFVLDPSVYPVVHPPRRIAVSLLEKVRAELQRMEGLGVIAREWEPTDCVNSLITVHKPDGSVRLCMDPSHLNKAIKRRHFLMKTGKKSFPGCRMPKSSVFLTRSRASGR